MNEKALLTLALCALLTGVPPHSLDRLNASAEELSKATGKVCLAAQADVRKPEQLRDAVAKTIEKFGRIDFVICGKLSRPTCYLDP